jgi:methylmalonyl-CoA mutase cobalamin-binding domain/chain
MTRRNPVSSLSEAIVELDRDKALREVESRVSSGEEPAMILAECKDGMEAVGALYTSGEYFLAELVLSGDIFKATVETLMPYLKKGEAGAARGKVILATPKGDIHDLGKGIVSTMLAGSGFEVHDLGVDVDTAEIVAAVKKIQPDFVGLSALLTTTLPSMKATVEALSQWGLRDTFKLMIGGGVTTEQFRDYVGADFQTLDVMEGVKYCIDGMSAKSGVVS